MVVAGLGSMQACQAGPWSSCGASVVAAPRCRPVLVPQPDVLLNCVEGVANLATMLTCRAGPSSYRWPGPGSTDACAATSCGAWPLTPLAREVAMGLGPCKVPWG